MELRLLSSCLSFLPIWSAATNAGAKDERSSRDYHIEILQEKVLEEEEYGDKEEEDLEGGEEEANSYEVEEEDQKAEDKSKPLWWPDPSSITRMTSSPATLRRLLQALDDGGGRIQLSRLLRLAPDPAPAGLTPQLKGWYNSAWSAVAIEEVAKAATARRGFVGCVASLMSAFEFYDRDGDGVISASDLCRALQDVIGAGGGLVVVEEEEEGDDQGWGERCEAMVKAFDREEVGGVCFDDFARMMLSS